MEGRARPSIQLKPEEEAALEGIANGKGRAGLRARALLLLARGTGVAEAARALRVSRNTIGNWKRRFQRFQLRRLQDAPRPGRPRRADEAFLRLMREAAGNRPAAYGYSFTAWSARRLSEHLREVVGVHLCARQVSRWLVRLGVSLEKGSGRKHLFLTSPDQCLIEACRSGQPLVLGVPEEGREAWVHLRVFRAALGSADVFLSQEDRTRLAQMLGVIRSMPEAGFLLAPIHAGEIAGFLERAHGNV